MLHQTMKRIWAGITALAAAITLLSALSLFSFAAPALPRSNTAKRHTVCTELSDEAKAYYSGQYSVENLMSLSGAVNTQTSYDAARGNALYSALSSLMSGTQTFYPTYSGSSEGSLAYYWRRTDAVSGSSTSVLFYCDVMNANGVIMNREHVWPKSRASFYQMNGGSDLHHLRPALTSVNEAKSDHTFGDVKGVFSNYQTGNVSGKEVYYLMENKDLFECKDDVKGDVVRILLYVYVRWGQPNLYSNVSSSKLPARDSDDSNNNGAKVIESLETLLRWCEDDPVDTWEMERNDLIARVQGNRNVFIDYPEFAFRLFGREVPEGMQTPTSAGCRHEWQTQSTVAASCLKEGSLTKRCSLCGETRTERTAALGHTDANSDDRCDRCGVSMTVNVDLKRSTVFNDGAHAVIYHPRSGQVLTNDLQSNRVSGADASPENGTLRPPNNAAVFLVKAAADNAFYLISNGKYLTSAPSGNGLTYDDTPGYYALWRAEAAPGSDLIYVVNVNARYGANVQALEFYNSAFTTYSKQATDAYYFSLYKTADHVWDEGKTSGGRSCVEAQTTQYTCLVCGETKAETRIAGEHRYEQKERYDPTCLKEGKIVYRCSVCGDVKEEILPLRAHEMEVRENTATCLTDGETVSVCRLCGFETREPCPAPGHSYESRTDHEATCLEGGTVVTVCTRCGEKHTDYTAPLGHDFGHWEVTKEPTADEEGEMIRVCLRDPEHIEKKTLEKLGGASDDESASPTEENSGQIVALTSTEEPSEPSLNRDNHPADDKPSGTRYILPAAIGAATLALAGGTTGLILLIKKKKK